MLSSVLSSVLFALLAVSMPVSAGMTCDGVDDRMDSGHSITALMSAPTGALMAWYLPTGTAGTAGFGEAPMVFSNSPDGDWAGIYRDGDYSGSLDRLYLFNWDGSQDEVPATYSVNAWIHLAWVHDSGTLSFYVNGALVGSVASGDTDVSSAPTLWLCLGAVLGGEFTQGTLALVQTFQTVPSVSMLESLGKGRTYGLANVQPTVEWRFETCTPGASADGVEFPDRSGNARTITGDNGSNDTGLACAGNDYLSYPWGVE